MKKIVIILCLLLLTSVKQVSATSYEDSIAGVAVVVTNNAGETFDGHIDLLVPKSDYEGEINTKVNSGFENNFSNYEIFDYLNETEWISYCAYVEDAHCSFNTEYEIFKFAITSGEYKRLGEIKFIHVDSSGNIVKISDTYRVPNPFVFQDFSGLNSYSLLTNEFQSDMGSHVNSSIFALFTIITFLLIVFSLIGTVFAYLIKIDFKEKLDFKNNLWPFIYFLFMSLVLFAIGIVLIFNFNFIQRLIDSAYEVLIVLLMMSLLEMLTSYFLVFHKESKEVYLKFVAIYYGSIFAIFVGLVLGMFGISLF